MAKKEVPQASAAAGLVLVNSSLRPVWFNAEAIQILGYPEKPGTGRLDVFLRDKVQSNLISRQPSPQPPFVTELRSGRRRYLCRAFHLGIHAAGPTHPSVALLLERTPLGGLISLSEVSEQFNLTTREGQTLEYLLQGLSGKEIADRMKISPNTVKSYFRLIMIKMGVSTRSGIVAKIVKTKP